MNIISVGTASIFSVQSVVGLNENWREVGPGSRSELRGRCTVLYVVSFKGGGERGVEINGGSRSCTLLSAHEGLWLLCALSADPSSLLCVINGVLVFHIVCMLCRGG